jgi:hypothetical protein
LAATSSARSRISRLFSFFERVADVALHRLLDDQIGNDDPETIVLLTELIELLQELVDGRVPVLHLGRQIYHSLPAVNGDGMDLIFP